MNDEFIRIFAEDDTVGKEGGRPSVKKQAPWKVAIIDDEADVHQVTKMAMKGVEVYGRPLTFISAYSAAEGYDLLQNNPDTCLILLDVVMKPTMQDCVWLTVSATNSEISMYRSSCAQGRLVMHRKSKSSFAMKLMHIKQKANLHGINCLHP
jgi:hypothetical protein